MITATVEDVQARLPEMLDRLTPGESVVITRDGKPVARLLPESHPRKPRTPGSAKGVLVVLQEDDDHLKDFAEYTG